MRQLIQKQMRKSSLCQLRRGWELWQAQHLKLVELGRPFWLNLVGEIRALTSMGLLLFNFLGDLSHIAYRVPLYNPILSSCYSDPILIWRSDPRFNQGYPTACWIWGKHQSQHISHSSSLAPVKQNVQIPHRIPLERNVSCYKGWVMKRWMIYELPIHFSIATPLFIYMRRNSGYSHTCWSHDSSRLMNGRTAVLVRGRALLTPGTNRLFLSSTC